jgi:hypothetical protein
MVLKSIADVLDVDVSYFLKNESGEETEESKSLIKALFTTPPRTSCYGTGSD